MSNNGFRKLPDWLEHHPRNRDPNFVAIVARLSMMARFKLPRQASFRGKTIELEIGQLTTGRRQLSVDSGTTESCCKNALKRLFDDQRITIETDNQCSLITCTWITEQTTDGQQTGQRVDNDRTTSGQRMDTNTESRVPEEPEIQNPISPVSSKPTRTRRVVRKERIVDPETPICEWALIKGDKWHDIVLERFPRQGITIEDQQRAAQDLLDAGYSEKQYQIVAEMIYDSPDNKFPNIEHLRSLNKLLRKPPTDSPYGSKGANYSNWMDVFLDIAKKRKDNGQ